MYNSSTQPIFTFCVVQSKAVSTFICAQMNITFTTFYSAFMTYLLPCQVSFTLYCRANNAFHFVLCVYRPVSRLNIESLKLLIIIGSRTSSSLLSSLSITNELTSNFQTEGKKVKFFCDPSGCSCQEICCYTRCKHSAMNIPTDKQNTVSTIFVICGPHCSNLSSDHHDPHPSCIVGSHGEVVDI